MATAKKPIKKAQTGAKTKDSTNYFNKERDRYFRQASIDAEFGLRNAAEESMKKAAKASKDSFRQNFKGDPGFDKNGYPVKKKKAKSGTTIAKAKDGMWMQKAAASIKKRGTAGKCTPITKPGCTGKAKALAKTFKKIAKSNKKK